MAIDKNELTRLLSKVPTILEKELPDLKGRIKWVDTQIEEYQKIMYRHFIDLETSKNFATKDDADAVQVAENKIREVTGSIKGVKWTLETLRAIKRDLLAEQKAK